MIAVVKDIRARKEAEAELRMQKALLESQSEASIDGILVTAHDGKIVSYNRRFLDLWGLSEALIEAGWGEGLLCAMRTIPSWCRRSPICCMCGM